MCQSAQGAERGGVRAVGARDRAGAARPLPHPGGRSGGSQRGAPPEGRGERPARPTGAVS